MTKPIVMHEDHPATCFCCVFFNADYEGDWSDMTPGSGVSVACQKGHFRLGEYDLGETPSYHAKLLQAQTCEDFDPVVPKKKGTKK